MSPNPERDDTKHEPADDDWDIGLTDEEAKETRELINEVDIDRLAAELDEEEAAEAEDRGN